MLWKLLLIGLALANYLSFIIAIWTVFNRKGKADHRLGVLSIGSLASMAAELWFIWSDEQVQAGLYLAGAVILVFSLSMFWSVARQVRRAKLSPAFSDDRPEFIHTSGPYRYVRHPFYTCYILSYVAGLVATLNPILLAVVAFMFIIYTMAARMEEQKFAHSELAQDYADYKARTWRFFPKPSFLSPHS